MRNDSKYIVVILLLVLAICIKTCSKPIKTNQPMNTYIDSLELSNKALEDSMKLGNSVIEKLKSRNEQYGEELIRVKKNIKDIKMRFSTALDVIDFISLDSNVLYLRVNLKNNTLELSKDSTVSINADDVKEINKTFVSAKYLKDINDSLETEIWVAYTQHVVDDQIIQLQDSNIKGLDKIIDNKNLALKALSDEVKVLQEDNRKAKRLNKLRNAVTASSVVIATASIVLIRQLLK